MSHQNLYMEALIPSTSEYNLIWGQGHCRCIQTEVITGLGPSPVWPKKEETRAQACPQREHCEVRARPAVAQQQLRNTKSPGALRGLRQILRDSPQRACDNLISGFYPPEQWDSKFGYKLPVCGTSLWQAWQANTVSKPVNSEVRTQTQAAWHQSLHS